jgi:two-component system chemotaxis sensor kinase CheA
MAGLSPESLAAIRIVFFQECEAHLAQVETGLTALQGGDGDPETIGGVYRAVHSVRGGAGIFQLDALVRFSQAFEAVLAEVRAGRLEPGPDGLRLLRRAADRLADLIDAGRTGREPSSDGAAPLLAELAALTPGIDAPAGLGELDFTPRPMAFQPLSPAGRAPARPGEA